MKRRRHVSPDKARAAILGGFYTQVPLPGVFTCSVCGAERHSVGDDGLCLRCHWEKRTGTPPAAIEETFGPF
jgi:hypothetical protein